MKFIDLLTMSINNLRRRRLRTFLTVIMRQGLYEAMGGQLG